MDSSTKTPDNGSTTTATDQAAVKELEPVPQVVQVQATAAPSTFTTTLNPHARAFHLPPQRKPEDRSLFLTFSRGFPLTEDQIARFFTFHYGLCVEEVFVHWPDPQLQNPPLFGKIVFYQPEMPNRILNGQNQAKFFVEGRPLWCKKFDPTKKQDGAKTRTQ